MNLTIENAKKVLEVVDHGLCAGIGVPEPGKLCVEAAVCYALGLPHGDDPACVGDAVRRFKIRLNDAAWPNDQERARGLRKLAIAQLGSDTIDQQAFARNVARETIRRILPIAIRRAAKFNPSFADRLEASAVTCEQEPTQTSARAARVLLLEVRNADAAYAAADAAAYAAAAADAADAAADAAAYAAAAADKTHILTLSAEIGLEALIEGGSPGCQWLHLCDAETVTP